MIFSTLVDKQTREFAHHMSNGEFGLCEIPKLMSKEIVLDDYLNYLKEVEGVSDTRINYIKSNYDLILVTLVTERKL